MRGLLCHAGPWRRVGSHWQGQRRQTSRELSHRGKIEHATIDRSPYESAHARRSKRMRTARDEVDGRSSAMHSLELVNVAESVEESDRPLLEGSLGHRVPDDYWAFLRRHNGGGLPFGDQAVFRFQDTVHRESNLVFLHYEARRHAIQGVSVSLVRVYEQTRRAGVIPPECLIVAIGEDVDILLRLFGSDAGQVLVSADEPIPSEGLQLLPQADSFTRFVEQLSVEHPRTQSSPLFHAAECGDLEQLTKLLQTSSVHAEDQGGDQLVSAAIGRSSSIRFLLQRGLDVAHRDSHGRNALHYAAAGACVEALELILQQPGAAAALKAADKTGRLPADYVERMLLTPARESLLERFGVWWRDR